MAFDKEFQDALMRDAQALRDQGIPCEDPIFFDTIDEQDYCLRCGVLLADAGGMVGRASPTSVICIECHDEGADHNV